MPTEVEKWDKDEIKRLAQASGKPLEIRCAEAFLTDQWKVRLGTYFVDAASEKIRELDFLAEKEFHFQWTRATGDVIHWHTRARVLGSCKGFPPEHGPATYSVKADGVLNERPGFICYECGIYGRNIAQAMREQSAENFLQNSALKRTSQIVGFDIIQRKEDQKKSTQVEYLRKTDRDLYEGLDSAIKASIFWYQEDRRQNRLLGQHDHAYLTLNIPLLVTSLPFWDVSIDRGTTGEPELKGCGFHVGLYPSGDIEKAPESVMSVVWEVAKLKQLTWHLHQLHEFFLDEVSLQTRKT